MLDLAVVLLRLAEKGLARRKQLDRNGRDETRYLRPLQEIVARGITPAEELLEKFNGPWKGSVEPIFDEYAYLSMAKGTPATVALEKAGVAFTLHEYDYDPNAAAHRHAGRRGARRLAGAFAEDADGESGRGGRVRAGRRRIAK